MKDELTDALDLPDIPPHEFRHVRERILTDNFVYNAVLNALVAERAPALISALPPISKQRLREKLALNPPTALAKWAVLEFLQDGHPYVHAQCPRCNQSMDFPAPRPRVETHFFDSGELQSRREFPLTAKEVRAVLDRLVWQHCGKTESAPKDIAMLAEQTFMRLVKQK